MRTPQEIVFEELIKTKKERLSRIEVLNRSQFFYTDPISQTTFGSLYLAIEARRNYGI